MRRSNIDFVGRRVTWLILSGVLVAISLGGLLLLDLNLSIDFVGGSSYLLEGTRGDLDATELADAATAAGATDVRAQVKEENGVSTGAIVRAGELDPGSAEEEAVRAALTEASEAETINLRSVGSTWGRRISTKALEGLVVFLIIVVIYISLRLDAKMAGVAVVALLHDLVVTAGIYAIIGFTISPATVIALLTILGYSLYDTVVVFDRVRESTGHLGVPGRETYSEAVNQSMNDVLWRSINTSMTSLMPVGSLLFVGSFVLGADTLQDLSLALFIGLASGAYSSLFLAGPLLAWWKEREPEYARLAARWDAKSVRAERKSTGRGSEVPSHEDDAGHEVRDAVEVADDVDTPAPKKKRGGGTGAKPPGYVRGPGRKTRRQRK